MKVRRTPDQFHIDLTPAEARVLLDELSNVRGGARLPKLRQVCAGIEALFAAVEANTPPARGRPPREKTVS